MILCRGCGFVQFPDERLQKRALDECQGAVGLGGKPLRLSLAANKWELFLFNFCHKSHVHFQPSNPYWRAFFCFLGSLRNRPPQHQQQSDKTWQSSSNYSTSYDQYSQYNQYGQYQQQPYSGYYNPWGYDQSASGYYQQYDYTQYPATQVSCLYDTLVDLSMFTDVISSKTFFFSFRKQKLLRRMMDLKVGILVILLFGIMMVDHNILQGESA